MSVGLQATEWNVSCVNEFKVRTKANRSEESWRVDWTEKLQL
jgi:hypothetical protein